MDRVIAIEGNVADVPLRVSRSPDGLIYVRILGSMRVWRASTTMLATTMKADVTRQLPARLGGPG